MATSDYLECSDFRNSAALAAKPLQLPAVAELVPAEGAGTCQSDQDDVSHVSFGVHSLGPVVWSAYSQWRCC